MTICYSALHSSDFSSESVRLILSDSSTCSEAECNAKHLALPQPSLATYFFCFTTQALLHTIKIWKNTQKIRSLDDCINNDTKQSLTQDICKTLFQKGV
jgi:hypothetical protein